MLPPGACAHQTNCIVEMMRSLGIEPGGGVLPRLELNYVTLFRRCQECSSKKRCRDWLDHEAGLEHFAPTFCPNAEILFELQFDQVEHGQENG